MMNDDRLPNILLVGQPSRTKRKASCPWMGWEDIIRKNSRGTATSWEDVKGENFEQVEMRRSMLTCVGLIRLGAAVCCQ